MTTSELLARWEARALDALPTDAMLINLHARELREALADAAPEVVEPSPTSGMNMAQRILHVGGRNPPGSTYVEFGSIQAVEALVRHVLRDTLPQHIAEPASPQGFVLVPAELDGLFKPIRSVLVDRFSRVEAGECLEFDQIWRDLIAAATAPKEPS